MSSIPWTAEHHHTMPAYVLEPGSRELVERQVKLASPQAQEVLIETAACGVCHTDLHVVKEEVGFPRPAVLGHEVSGIVRAVGDQVTHVSPGDRVACSFIMPCGHCRHCAKGLEDICETFFTQNRLGGHLFDGTSRLSDFEGNPVSMYSMAGHAQYCVSPSRAVFRIPDTVRLTDAAVLGCSLFTAYGVVHTVAGIQAGDTVAVIAAGGVGLSVIHLARAAGASRVIAIDIDQGKLALAAELGATDTIDSTRDDPVQALKDLLGHGADVVVEALGSAATVQLAVDLTDDGGRAVLAGIAPVGQTIGVDITKVVRRKIRILGSFGARASTAMPAVLELAGQGVLNLEALITDRFSFAEVDAAYQRLNAGEIRGRGLIEINSGLDSLVVSS